MQPPRRADEAGSRLYAVRTGQPARWEATSWPLSSGEFGTDWHLVLAYISLTIAPVVLLLLAAQRHIVARLTAGAVKG